MQTRDKMRIEREKTMKYGIIHNNHFYMWHPKKKDGTEMKIGSR